jgi:hypothetical protein
MLCNVRSTLQPGLCHQSQLCEYLACNAHYQVDTQHVVFRHVGFYFCSVVAALVSRHIVQASSRYTDDLLAQIQVSLICIGCLQCWNLARGR